MLLEIENLRVAFQTGDGEVNAVNGVSFGIDRGETLAIVGESGSGKSQTAFAAMGLLAKNGAATGKALYKGQNLLTLKQKQLNKFRSEEVAMIFQDPMTSLNPYIRISEQMAEVLTLHKGVSKKHAIAESVRMLDAVRIPDAANRIRSYPHEFSGGMRQRIMIAMSLLCQPSLLIADEPTTAVDVTIQAQILELLDSLRSETGMALLLITHDLGVVAEACERVVTMYAGELVESGEVDSLLEHPSHPYTSALLRAIPRVERRKLALEVIPGRVPLLGEMPDGCRFEQRCSFAGDGCEQYQPLTPRPRGGAVRCHRHAELELPGAI